MPAWFYFDRPTHLAFHDLTTTTKPSDNLRALLGLGLKFCPTPRFTTHDLSSTITRFSRDLQLKTFFAGATKDEDDEEVLPKLYLRSTWTPPKWEIPRTIHERIDVFGQQLPLLFPKRRGKSNLLPNQLRALSSLAANRHKLMIVKCDKNLGPAVIETPRYIKRAFSDHLGDSNTYMRLHKFQADALMRQIRTLLLRWIDKYKTVLSKMELKYIRYHLRHNKDPYPKFYLLFKVHKDPWATRPIVSCSGSLLHSLGLWVDSKLNAIAQTQRSYIKNSLTLKQRLLKLRLPPTARLFTADAVSMYTNIDTTEALRCIAAYLRANATVFKHVPMEALIEALHIIMENNLFEFGDTYHRQLIGTAMGTPPAPPYATLYYAIHEETFLDRFQDNLPFYMRYIDDVIAGWITTNLQLDPATWKSFQEAMPVHKLKWTFSPRSTQVDFMDLTVRLEQGRIVTTMYEKALNLYLYLPPHSAHPPGVLQGLVIGNVIRIHTLCSDPSNIESLTRQFYSRLLRRGYKPDILAPLFEQAMTKAAAYQPGRTSPTPTGSPLNNQIFLHLPFHPQNPPSFKLQSAFREHVLAPRYKHPLPTVRNRSQHPINVGRMVIAYSRPRNIGDLLSYRRLSEHHGPPVLSYLRIT